jgi:hypothetical protein
MYSTLMNFLCNLFGSGYFAGTGKISKKMVNGYFAGTHYYRKYKV